MLYDVIHIRTLRHINDDFAQCAILAKTETTEAGVEKVKISANHVNFINKILLAIFLKKMNTNTLYFVHL